MTKLKITQVRSTIKQTKRQKATIAALGLGKINKTVTLEKIPSVEGMVRKVTHLVVVQEVEE